MRLSRRRKSLAAAQPLPVSGLMLEPLEARAMLSVDITGAYVGLSQVTSGQLNPITIDLQNLGDEDSKGAGTVQFYLSADNTFDAGSDLILGKALKASPKLGAAGSETDSANVTFNVALPYDTVAGDYFLIAVVDPANKVVESDETNNAIIGAVTVVQPDYDLTATLSDSRIPPAIVQGLPTKGSVKVNITHGGAISFLGKPPKIDITVVARPADASDDSEDVVIGTLTGRSIAGLNSASNIKSYNVNVVLPSDLPAGDYNIVGIVDTTNLLAETNENNNEGQLAGDPIAVAAAFQDLELTAATKSLGSTALGGDAALGTVVITNKGNVLADGLVDVTFIARRDGEDDVVLGQTLGAKVKLKPGAFTKPIVVKMLLPGDLTDGATYDVHAIITPAGSFVGDETENNTIGPIGDPVTITQPDYDLTATISDVTVASLLQGAAAKGTLQVNISNDGATALPVKSPVITVRVVARPDSAIDTSQDVLISTIGKIKTDGLSNVSAPISAIAKLTIPGSLASGDFKLVAIIDSTNVQVESDETNNEAIADDLVTVQAAFEDVQLTTATHTIPSTALGGDNATGTVVLTNLGNVPAVGSVTVTFVARREGESDTTLGTASNVSVNIKPGTASKPINVPLTIANSLTNDATYSVHALITPTDLAGDITDNNSKSPAGGSFTVTQPPPYLLSFGDTVTFIQNNYTEIDGPFGTKSIGSYGNFTASNGATGIYSWNLLSGVPGGAGKLVTVSLTLDGTFPLQIATIRLTYKGTPVKSPNGLSFTFADTVTGSLGTTQINIVDGGIGSILETEGQFKQA